MKRDQASVAEPRVSSSFLAAALAALIGLLVGVAASRPAISLPTIVLAAAVFLLVGLLLRDAPIPVIPLERLCCYLSITTGFFGSALFPISIGPLTLFPFRIFILALWVLFAIRVLMRGGRLVSPRRGIRFYLVFLGIWLGYAALTLGWARSTIDAVRHVGFLVMGFSVVLFASYYLCNDRDLKRLFSLWLGVFGVLLLIGLWEHLSGQHLPTSRYHEDKLLVLKDYVRAEVMYRPTGTFNNPNDYATFLALGIPFGLSLAQYTRKLWLRALGMASLLLGGYLILTTGSRANLVAVLLELAFLWVFLRRGVRKLKWVVATAAGAGVVLAVAPTVVRSVFRNVSVQLISLIDQASQETGSVYVRWNLVRNGLLFVYSTAGRGVGAGNAEYWMANFAQYNTFGILNPHNWWLELLIDYGIFIFAGYILFYLRLIRELWQAHKNSAGTQRIICESLLVSLVGFSVASLSPSSVMAFIPQWLLFASVVAFLGNPNLKRGIQCISS